MRHLDAVIDKSVHSLSNGAAVKLDGTWQRSRGQGQDYELLVNRLQVLGENDAAVSAKIVLDNLPQQILTIRRQIRFRRSIIQHSS